MSNAEDEAENYDPKIYYYHIHDICGIHICANMHSGQLFFNRFEGGNKNYTPVRTLSKQTNLFEYAG